ncbi:quinolinate synthetase [Alkalibacter saccharofermentans DSM 14828]|uniref:Quinolinate synthase n=2 Tax=Alkalibacter TaxID=274470 RepID=A0A1M4TMU9_9FIRM|nr:quinolinate synthetase [Alkalibacter saccharofermentans DSM 14828]
MYIHLLIYRESEDNMVENLKDKINRLKKEKNAVILAHYYQRPEIQDIADVVGDSYFLSKYAQECKEEVIVFCGVLFMAESAKILSPEKTVLLPVYDAGCPMADMADYEDIKEFVKDYPEAAVVAYINSSTEVKTLCDVCVTSSSAEKIIRNLPQEDIVFLPDRNLGGYLAEKIPEKNFILWDGFCITHEKVDADSIVQIKQQLSDAKVLVHPECPKPVRDLADYIGSTSGIIDFATKSDAADFVIVTEEGIMHELKTKNPEKNFYVPGKTMTCINMKKITLEDVCESLEKMKYPITLDEEVRLNAFKSLENMHKLSR